MPRTPKKPPAASAAKATTPPTYAAWRDAAATDLLERHGMKASVMRERTWRNLFIRNLSPSEAADRAAADYKATRPLVDRSGRRKR